MTVEIIRKAESLGKIGKGFFFNYIQKIKELQNIGLYNDELRKMISRLEIWVNEEGYPLILDALNKIDISQMEKINGFFEYYNFLIENSKNDCFNLIDLLFTIPSVFSKMFAVNDIMLINLEVEGYHSERYNFLGSLDMGSLLFVIGDQL